MSTIEKKIARLDKRIAAGQKKFDKLLTWYSRDGVSDQEMKSLERVEVAIQKLKSRKDTLNAERGIFNIEEEIEVITPTKKEFGDAKYFNDDYFKGKFKQSIKDWTQDGGIALNSVRTYMIAEESPAGLSIGDVVKVVAIIFPAAKFVETALDVAKIVEKGFNSALSARSKKPSLNEIHKSWGEALTALAGSNLDPAYEKFIKQWRADNKIPNDVEEAWTNVLGPDCQNFAKNHLPKSSDVQKAFLAKILSTVEDSYDYDDEAGQAELYMTMLAGNFLDTSGMLDDVSEQLMKAVSTVWKGARVIDLPVKIDIIIENVNGSNLAEFKRSSRTPGDTGFRQTDGDKEIFEAFMKKKGYLKPKVSDIKHDMRG